MPALRIFIVTAVLGLVSTALTSNADAVDPPIHELRTWTVQPRTSQSSMQSSGPATANAQPSPVRSSRQISHVEELPTAEPPLAYRTKPLARKPRSVFAPLNSVLPVQFIDSFMKSNRSPTCDEIGCDSIGGVVLYCDGACDGLNCNRCGESTYWARADYLYWWLDGANVPALVTTSPAGTDRSNAGVLGLSTTSVLVGADEFGDEGQSGARIEFGRWFPERGNLGWHFAYLGLDDANDRFGFASTGIPILARPFFSVEPASVGQNAELVSFPGELEGNVSVAASTSYDAAEFMFRWMLANSRNRRLQLALGYQYNGLEDDLSISDFKRVIGGSSGLAIGTTLTENDRFQTDNAFHGVALGVLGSIRNCRTTVDLGMRLGLGNNRSKVRINGSATSNVPATGGPNTSATTVGGLLAQSTNIGFFEGDTFAVAPELHVDVGYDIYPQVRLLAGYRFLYWSQLARAAEQIDTGVNLSQLDPSGLDGEPRPQFDLRLTDFWAQGLNVGLDYRF